MPSTSTANQDCKNESPAVTVVDIRDPTAAGENIEVLNQDLVQLKSRPLRAKRIIVRLGHSLVVYQSTNSALRARTSVSADLVGFVSFGPHAAGTFDGLTVRPELLLAAAPGVAGEFVVEADYQSFSVLLSPASLGKIIKIRGRESEYCTPRDIEILQSTPAAAQGLFKWGKQLAKTAAEEPALFDDYTSTRNAAHRELVEILLAALGSTTNYEPSREERTGQNHSRIVKAAQDYAITHTNERVSVTDLCKVAGASERTLQYAFKEIMEMSPIAYLTRLRLHRVREALRNSTSDETTVSSAALSWGFWHFGDFSRSYKNCFGELPSETFKEGRL